MRPPTPAATASAAAFRTLSLLCWTTPGINATGCASAMPSFTNNGSTRTVYWPVVVRFQVMANGAVSARPAAISILPNSTLADYAKYDKHPVGVGDPPHLAVLHDPDIAGD